MQTFDQERVLTALAALVGWRQNHDASGWQLNNDNLAMSSRFDYNGVHPLLTFDNLMSIAPQFDLIHDTDAAAEIALNNWLKEKTDQAILSCVTAWLETKNEFNTAPTLLTWERLLPEYGNPVDTVSKTGKTVGLAVKPRVSESMATHVTAIGVQLTEDQSITISLHRTGKPEAVDSIDVDYTEAGGTQWVSVEWRLESQSTYYISYQENDLQGQAVNGIVNSPGGVYQSETLPAGRYLTVAAFGAPAAADGLLWDWHQDSFVIGNNFGLNLKLTVGCDYTEFIVSNARLFNNLVRLSVGISMMNELAYNANSRVNRNEANVSRAEVIYAIEGDPQSSGKNMQSLNDKYMMAMGALQLDTAQIDPVCLTCRRRSIRYRSQGPRY